MQRLTRLLAAEERRRRLEIVVVAAPGHARPAGVAHPDEQPHTVFRARLVHRTVAVVVLPLCQCGKGGSVVRHAEGAVYYSVECRTALCALHAVVVCAPRVALRPQLALCKRAVQTLCCHHVRHATLGVQLASLVLEVELRCACPVWSVSAHAVVGRAGDISQSWVQCRDILSQHLVDRCRWVALVASAVYAYRRMLSHAQRVVACVGEEHVLVLGVGSVTWVGEPEVLPHHDAVFVACVVELFVAGHAHPVSYHVEVHVAMVAHSNVVFACAVEQILLAESPVAAQRYEASAVDIYREACVHVAVGHLSDARLVVYAVRGCRGGLCCGALWCCRCVCHKLKSGVVEVRLTISVGPPQAHVAVFELCKLVGREGELSLQSWRECHLTLKLYLANPSAQRSRHVALLVVAHHYRCRHGGGGVGECQL